MSSAPVEECVSGDVRLVNGTSVSGKTVAGRLEVCSSGLWGTVCRLDSWTTREASVVCRQLGFDVTDTGMGIDEKSRVKILLLYSAYWGNSTKF